MVLRPISNPSLDLLCLAIPTFKFSKIFIYLGFPTLLPASCKISIACLFINIRTLACLNFQVSYPYSSILFRVEYPFLTFLQNIFVASYLFQAVLWPYTTNSASLLTTLPKHTHTLTICLDLPLSFSLIHFSPIFSS